VNRQSLASPSKNPTNGYTYEGDGVGVNVGLSAQAVVAWGKGAWEGTFRSINVTYRLFSASIFWSPGEDGWVGFTAGPGIGIPVAAAFEETHYTCVTNQ
jgi:hypothetical protein